MKSTTCSRRAASCWKITSESAFSCAMIVFWRPRIFSTAPSSRSAGAPERIAALRFSAFPTRAVPNSLMISWRRRLKGSRRVF
jgi:hypothetical protein